MQTIVTMKFGSHLYGTNTKDSDVDYKGIFMPTKEQILLGNIPKSINKSTRDNKTKNTKDDVDYEIYSLHYFLKLCVEGQTVALDMLHAPTNMIIESNYIWWIISNYKEKFYTRNLQAFIGYARRQAAKYGIRSSRLGCLKEVISTLEKNK